MRIVHEVLGETQSNVLSHGPYATPDDEQASGFPVEILIVASHSDGDDEYIEIQGDARCIRDAMLDVVDMIDVTGAKYVDDGLLDPQWKHDPPDTEPEIPDEIGELQWLRTVALADEWCQPWARWALGRAESKSCTCDRAERIMTWMQGCQDGPDRPFTHAKECDARPVCAPVSSPKTWTEAQRLYNAWRGERGEVAEGRPWPTLLRDPQDTVRRVYTVWPDGSVDLTSVTDGVRAHVEPNGTIEIQGALPSARALSELSDMASVLHEHEEDLQDDAPNSEPSE